MDREQIRKALDHFENDKYVDAKEIIQKEIQGKRDIFLKDKIGLSGDITPVNTGSNDDDNNDNDDGAGSEE